MNFEMRAKTVLLAATMLTTGFAATSASAQAVAAADADADDAIIVTATRRSTALLDVPINVSVIGAEQLREQRIDDVRGLAAFTPGVTIVDTGPRGTGNIVLRGIAADDTGTSGNNTDNTLAIYLGEVPLYLDFKLLDMQRVEVLLGPQGTLYGLGTLAGAIRYIPNRPDSSDWFAEVHGRVFARSESRDLGIQGDATVNVPIIEGHLAFRTTTGYFFEPGFIDYPFLLQNPGTSLPQPGGSSIGTAEQYGANLRRQRDVNFDRTFTTRNQLLLQYNENIKAYATLAYQESKTDGRQANGNGVLGSGRYEGPWRYLDPLDRRAHLGSLETEINLFDFAQLVTATAWTDQHNVSSFDNTDLLLDLDYDYEKWPAFSSFATGDTKIRQFNQEVRLVSTHGGPIKWTIGGFYNNQRFFSYREEYVPGYFRAFPPGTPNPSFSRVRPDDLEYISYVRTRNVEKAIFGEATWQITDAWQVTGGGRYYQYDAYAEGATEVPMTSGGVRRTPFPLKVFDPSRVRAGETSADGFVYKINTSYKFNPGLLLYGTYSTGYRVGGVNRVAPCIIPLPPGQNVCALPNELVFGPDKTKNYEVGLRGSFFDNRLTVNLAGFIIDWTQLQVGSQTVNGAVGITLNAGAARSKGIEFSGQAKITDRLTLAGTYAYLDARLTEDAPGLVVGEDAFDGDRLPGSARHQGSLIANYSIPVKDEDEVVINWALTYQGDVLSRVGNRNFGETIPDYILNRATVFYRSPRFEFGVFANNIFNVYAISSVGNDFSKQTVNDGVFLRFYNRNVITPRTVGFEGRYRF
jgi:outer membrane receptor protein involved in Fe transport